MDRIDDLKDQNDDSIDDLKLREAILSISDAYRTLLGILATRTNTELPKEEKTVTETESYKAKKNLLNSKLQSIKKTLRDIDTDAVLNMDKEAITLAIFGVEDYRTTAIEQITENNSNLSHEARLNYMKILKEQIELIICPIQNLPFVFATSAMNRSTIELLSLAFSLCRMNISFMPSSELPIGAHVVGTMAAMINKNNSGSSGPKESILTFTPELAAITGSISRFATAANIPNADPNSPIFNTGALLELFNTIEELLKRNSSTKQ